MEELLQKVIAKVYQLNQKTEHDIFLNFIGHINAVEIYYYKNGFEKDNHKVSIMDFTENLTENNLKKALEKLEELGKEN